MSIMGEYARIPAAELERGLRDAAAGVESDPGPPVPEEHMFGIQKDWDVLHFLFERAGFAVDVVHGEGLFPGEDQGGAGYGPSRYLRPDRVRLAADALRATTYDQLVAEVTPAELAAADLDGGWYEPGALEDARDSYDTLVRSFAAAAEAGDALLVWKQ